MHSRPSTAGRAGLSISIACLAVAQLPAAPDLAAQEILLPGDPSLRPERISTGIDSTRVWRFSGDQGQMGPLAIQVVDRIERDGAELLRIVFTLESDNGNMHDTSTVRLPSLAPVAHVSRPGAGATWRSLEIRYDEGSARGTVTPADSAPQEFEAPMPGGAFDPSLSLVLLTAMPLAPGYEVRVPFFSHEKREVELHTYRVAGEQAMSFRGETVDVWDVEITFPDGRIVMAKVDQASGRVLRGETAVGDMRLVTMPAES